MTGPAGRKKESTPGTPKLHRTSLSAATGEVLTRFTRRRPSDLGHPEYSGVTFPPHPQPEPAMDRLMRAQADEVPHEMTSTGFDLPGYTTVQSLGVVRGVVVRSRSVFGTIGGSLQSLVGGNISLFTELAERTRKQAFDTMLVQAHNAGADAVIGIRYDANEMMKGVTEVLCYGTAVRVEPR